MILSEELRAEWDELIPSKSKRWTEESEAFLIYAVQKTDNNGLIEAFKKKYPKLEWTYSIITNRMGKLSLRRKI